jgi:hypothetical protein
MLSVINERGLRRRILNPGLRLFRALAFPDFSRSQHMDLTVHCPSCGGRTTADQRKVESHGYVICPYCRKKIPLQRGADGEPPAPGDGAG